VNPRNNEGNSPGVAHDLGGDSRRQRAAPNDPGEHEGDAQMESHERRAGDCGPAGETDGNRRRRTRHTSDTMGEIARRAGEADAGPEEIAHMTKQRLLLTAAEHGVIAAV